MLQYPLGALLGGTFVTYDLQRLNLLSEQEVYAVQRTNIEYGHKVMARMVSENIVRGDKNDFSKLITYLKTHSDTKYLVEYYEKKCKF